MRPDRLNNPSNPSVGDTDEEEYCCSDGSSGQARADPVATLYARVLPNPHKVRLDGNSGSGSGSGKQQPRREGQLPPLNPLFVQRFAADLARDAVGRQYQALAALLPRLEEMCPRELAALLAHVVEVFARTPSPTYRALLLGFLEAADWPLLAAATGTGAGSSGSASSTHTPALSHLERSSVSSYTSRTPGGITCMGSIAQALPSASPAAAIGRALYALIEEAGTYDTRARALAWRALGLLAEPSQPEYAALVDRLLTWALPSPVPEEPPAAALALHTLCRRHPPLLRVLVPTLERLLGGAELEEAAAVELMKTCRYTPLASLSSKERKALWMQLRDIVLERALPRLAHQKATATGLDCLATMAGTRIMRRRILRSGTVDTSIALVSEEHQDALAPILLTILSYARDGAALSEDLATHAAALSVQLVRALPAAPFATSASPSLHQRLMEHAAAALLAGPPPRHEEACRHRALFLRILGAAAAAHGQRWAGSVVDVLLHDDLLAWTKPSQGNGALFLAWCQALAAALGASVNSSSGSDDKAGVVREAKAQAAMASMVASLMERARALLASPADGDELADALDALLALASAGRREPLAAVLTGTLALLRQQQQQQQPPNAAATAPLVTLIAALAAVDVWGVVAAALLGPAAPAAASSEALQLLFIPSDNASESRELAAVVALLRAARGMAADQQAVLGLLVAASSASSSSSSSSSSPSSSSTPDDAMEVDGQGQPLPLRLPSASGWGRYRLAREAFLHGYLPLAHSLLAPLHQPAQQTGQTGLWLGTLRAISQAEAALLKAASPVSTASPCLDRREEVELAAIRPALRKALALLQRLEDGLGADAAADDGDAGCRRASFGFQRRFLQARLEFLLLTATLRTVVRELQLGGRPPGHKATRHHRHHTRLPLAFQRLEGRLWQLYREGLAHDPQTRWTLRSLMGVASFLRRVVTALVLQQPPTAEERALVNPHWPASPANPANRLPLVAVARALEARVTQEVLGPAPVDGQEGGASSGPATLPSLQASLALTAQIEASLAAVPWPYPRLFLRPMPRSHLWSLRLVAWGLGPEDVVAAARERPLPAAPPSSSSMQPAPAANGPPPPPLRPHSSAGGGAGGGGGGSGSSLSRIPSSGSGGHHHPPHQGPGLASTSTASRQGGAAPSLGGLLHVGDGGEEHEETLLEVVQGQPASFAVAGVIKGLPREALAVAHVKLTATVLREGGEDEEEEDDDERAGPGRAKRWSSAGGGRGRGRRRRRRSSGAIADGVSAASSFHYREVLAVPLCVEDGSFPGAAFKLPAGALPRPGEYTLLVEAVLVDGGGRSWVVPQGTEEDGRLVGSVVCVSAPSA